MRKLSKKKKKKKNQKKKKKKIKKKKKKKKQKKTKKKKHMVPRFLLSGSIEVHVLVKIPFLYLLSTNKNRAQLVSACSVKIIAIYMNKKNDVT